MWRYKRAKVAQRWVEKIIQGMLYCAILIAVGLPAVIEAIKIQSISVPDSVNSNSLEPLYLDCVFELDNRSNGQDESQFLVVKWILNNMLIYQWASNRKTFVNETMKHRIVEEQKNFTNGRPTHMPLTILNKTIDLTGLYECQVSAIISDDSRQKYMHVYVPADDIDLKKEVDEETNSLNVTCGAEGLYPEPIISLTVNNQKLDNASEYVVRNREQLYDINATFTLDLDELRPVTTFNCSLTIPEVNLTYYKALSFAKSGQAGDSSSSFEQQAQGNGAGLPHNNFMLAGLLALLLSASLELVRS